MAVYRITVWQQRFLGLFTSLGDCWAGDRCGVSVHLGAHSRRCNFSVSSARTRQGGMLDVFGGFGGRMFGASGYKGVECSA